jgi:hypothetical protein
MHDVAPMLTAWESFYVIVGSSSAGLTGLMFVVVTLIPESRAPASDDGLAAFATPNVVHFCAALLVSAILSAPWTGWSQPAAAIGVVGVAGVVYIFVVFQRARRQTGYTPVLEDWIWHMTLPLVAYLTFTISAVELMGRPTGALFGVAAATALLLFIGIHNAWDTVTFMALERRRARDEREKPAERGSGGRGDGSRRRT